jgi:spore coat protein U-like protein
VALAAFTASPALACTIGTVSVAFGAYNPRSATALDGVGTVNLNCPTTVKSAVITINSGGSGTYSQRRMASGSFVLGYNLFTTASRTIVWGDGSAGTGTVAVGKGVSSTSVHGRIPAGQNAGAGTYSESLIVTVTF